MTREELRRAFRQAQQEEFSVVPEQPMLSPSPGLEKRIARKLGLAPRRISRRMRAVVLLLVAVLLVMGSCTVYQAVTNGAYIKFTGIYTDYQTDLPEYHYRVRGYYEEASPVPHYQFPDPEGFIHLYDGSLEPELSLEHFDQWYNPDTGDILNFTQQGSYLSLLLETPFELKSIEQHGVTVFYGSSGEKGYAFWLNGGSAFTIEYWGNVSEDQLLEWVDGMKYTPYSRELDLNTVSSDYYCYLDDYYDPNQNDMVSIGKRFYYHFWDEIYDLMEEEETGRQENIDYNFASPPEGFTLMKTENNEYIGKLESGHFASNGATYTYEDAEGVQLILDQGILCPLPDQNGSFWYGITSSQPMENVEVADMEGLYSQEDRYSQLYWRYGGRMMWIYYYGDISKEDLIALAETVDYENGIPALPAPEEESGSAT